MPSRAGLRRVATLALGLWLAGVAAAHAQGSAVPELTGLPLALHHFYSARYEAAVEAAGSLRESEADGLAAYELRSSALHFQLKRLIGEAPNKGRAFKQCAECPALLESFLKDTAAGKALARARVKANPKDEAALFYLGKFDLNYIWLQLSTLGKKTGWGEYWDARRTLDAVLKMNPANVRARVARAWIDYIVDTRVPFGLQWMLGGGDRKRALRIVREAAAADADRWVRAEAEFALWEMLVRDKKPAEALEVARRLAQAFPENKELQRFIEKGEPAEGKGQR